MQENVDDPLIGAGFKRTLVSGLLMKNARLQGFSPGCGHPQDYALEDTLVTNLVGALIQLCQRKSLLRRRKEGLGALHQLTLLKGKGEPMEMKTTKEMRDS